jgi:hypothetical protein
MLVKEIVYEILDEIKANSDDAFFTEDHVIFLIKKYRSFLIKKEQDKEKNTTDVASEFEYQQICLDLEKVEAIPGLPCEGGYYLRTTEAIPKILEGTQPKVYPSDFYGNINVVFVSRDRMRYVGTNRYLQNIIYTSIGPDLHLYMKSSNPQFLYLEGDNKLRMTAIFEDFDAASELLCDAEGNSTPCDVLDSTFPIRDYLVPPLIELVVKELIGANYRPIDEVNNAKDNNAGLTVKN